MGSGWAQYRVLIRTDGAVRAVLPGLLARTSYAMAPLATLLFVQQSTGSFGLAGTAVALMALTAAVAGPVVGRLADRIGARPVITLLGMLHPLVLLTLVVAEPAGAPSGVLVLIAALSGFFQPPVGASVRALWARLVPAGPLLNSAYALESTLVEIIFVVGPALVGLLVALGGTTAGLLGSAALAAVGSIGYVTAPAVAHLGAAPTAGHGPTRRPVRIPGVRLVLLSLGLVAVGFSALEVGIPAAVVGGGESVSLGALLVGIPALGSALGGLWYGARSWTGPPVRRYLWLLGLVTLSMTPLFLAGSPVLLAALLLVAGLPMAPANTEEFAFLERLAAGGTHTETFAWAATVMAVATAAGNALAGFTADLLSPAAALALAPLACAAALIVAVLGRHTLARGATRSSATPVDGAVA